MGGRAPASDLTTLVDLLRRYSKLHSVRAPLERAAGHAQTVRTAVCSGSNLQIRRPHKLAHRLSAEQLEAIVCGYEAGLSVTRTAAELGHTDYAVRRVLLQVGVERRGTVLDAEEIAKAVELYGAGMSIKDIGLELGRANASIQKVLVKAKVELRPATRRWKLTAQQVNQAAENYRAGRSLTQLAQGLGVGQETVRRALAKRGVEMRLAGHPGPRESRDFGRGLTRR